MSQGGSGASIGLGQAIREAREKAKMSLRQLAGRIGVSAPFLSEVEHGRRGILKLAELAKVVGVTEEWLLGRSEVLTRREVEWINSNPEILALLRRHRARYDYPGPLRDHPPRARTEPGRRRS